VITDQEELVVLILAQVVEVLLGVTLLMLL